MADVGPKKEQFLEAFAECRAGRCERPTHECSKLASMEVQAAGDLIRIWLETKPGEKLDRRQIETCLDHTTEKLR